MERRNYISSIWLDNEIGSRDKDLDFRSDDLCFICKTPGNLILCDGPCGRAFHFRCLKLRRSDVGNGDWFCDDCLHHRPLKNSIYIKSEEDDFSVLDDRGRELYSYLNNSAHSVFEQSDVPFYEAIQIIMVLSEISRSATYPLCSSVFHLLHYCIDRLSSCITDGILIDNLSHFQDCLDRIQLLDIMERTGELHPFKQKLAEQLPLIFFYQRLMLKMLNQNLSLSETAAVIRIILLSAFILIQIGFYSEISPEDAIDLCISFIKEHMNDLDFLPDVLRLLQTLLMVLTRNGELLLNCDLFPYFTDFLSKRETLDRVDKGDERLLSWYVVCVNYLSFKRDIEIDWMIESFQNRLLKSLNQSDSISIPLGCNCVRALFARQWLIGFGPYPVSAFNCINKHNHYRNITPTSIKMFPLSLIGNLTGLYLTDVSQRSGLLIGGTSFMTKQRYLSLKKQQRHEIDLCYSSSETKQNIIGYVKEHEVYKTQKVNRLMVDAEVGKKKDDMRKEIRRKVMSDVSKMEFINGIEKTYYNTFVRDNDMLINHYFAFSKVNSFSSLRLQGKEIDSFVILSIVLEYGGIECITDMQWVDISESLGIDASQKNIKALQSHYRLEFSSFEK